jgi:hypothetical protein
MSPLHILFVLVFFLFSNEVYSIYICWCALNDTKSHIYIVKLAPLSVCYLFQASFLNTADVLLSSLCIFPALRSWSVACFGIIIFDFRRLVLKPCVVQFLSHLFLYCICQ